MAYNLSQEAGLYNDVVGSLKKDVKVPWAWNPDQGTVNAYTSQVNQLADQYTSQFTNLVGRAPSANEVNDFVRGYVLPNTNELADSNSARNQNKSTYVGDYINTYNQGLANSYAQEQLTSQNTEAQRLADLSRTQGNTAINNVEASLLDFQNRLLEKTRPHLLTSLQAQGLLDTGGLNMALAGAQKDAADSLTPFLSEQRLANEQRANDISYGGASAPYLYNQATIQNRVPYLQSLGQQATNQNYQTYLTNLNAQNDLRKMAYSSKLQNDSQPSLLRSLGQNFMGSLGESAGKNVGQWLGPSASKGGH